MTLFTILALLADSSLVAPYNTKPRPPLLSRNIPILQSAPLHVRNILGGRRHVVRPARSCITAGLLLLKKVAQLSCIVERNNLFRDPNFVRPFLFFSKLVLFQQGVFAKLDLEGRKV